MSAEYVNDRRLLLQALVPPKHHQLYSESASFNAAVNTLAKMLPAWIDGLAAQCYVEAEIVMKGQRWIESPIADMDGM